MELKPRPTYLSQLVSFRDTDFVKVLVGMRRCGKSSLLKLYARHLHDRGVESSRIIEMNFEAAEYLRIADYHQLLDELLPQLESASPEQRTYLLLDEIQLVSEWEKAVNALRLRGDVDIYLTGSNAYMLSSQLATLLSGRYVEIKIYPLSFSEFIDFVGSDETQEQLFERYITYGGLPPVVEQGNNRNLASTVLSGIYNTVFVKDIAQYIQVRNQGVFADLAAYLADTSGSHVSISNVEKRLQSAHRKTAGETIERYIQALVDAFLLYRAKRYDLRGGAILQGLEKYYPSDLGIRNMLLGFPQRNHGYVLENVVYNELIVRGYDVEVGKLHELEIDFVATRPDHTLLIQVSASLLDEATRDREFESLRKAPFGLGQKLIITYDTIGLGVVEDITIVNALSWLTSKDALA